MLRSTILSTSRSMSRTITLALLISAPAALIAASQADLAAKFVGAWKLVDIIGDAAGRPSHYDHPTGMIIYLPSGRMAVQIAATNHRQKFAPFTVGTISATDQEKAAAFDSYTAYYGTYTIDAQAGTITHHLESSVVPGRAGNDNVRWFEFPAPNRVVLIPVEDGKGGRISRQDATHKLIWERLP